MIDFTAAPATLPPGERIYAIGDIHGCLDRLVALHEMIAEDIAARPAEHTTLVHLGDYVDRGTDSAQVVEWLINQPPVPADEFINLMGNHEHMMLTAVVGEDKEAPNQWLMNGGADSLLELGTLPGRLAGRVGPPHPDAAFDVSARPGNQPSDRPIHVCPRRGPAGNSPGPADPPGPYCGFENHSCPPGLITVPSLFMGTPRSGSRSSNLTASRSIPARCSAGR